MAHARILGVPLPEHARHRERHHRLAGEGQVQREGGGVVLRLGQPGEEGDDGQAAPVEELVSPDLAHNPGQVPRVLNVGLQVFKCA